jgi:hypothetical protein
MSQFTERMMRAARLDVSLYEEVERDEGTLGQAMGVVVISSLAAGIGSIRNTGMTGIFTGTLGLPDLFDRSKAASRKGNKIQSR